MKKIIVISLLSAFFLNSCSSLKNKSAVEEKKIETKNLTSGERFLIEKSKEKDVVTLPSGLRYKVITAGIGAKPLATNTIKAHYHGTLINGTVFDSSVDRGQPFTAPVNRLIKGWIEALQLMQVGAKWELYVPSNLAYGERGSGSLIKANETLIFEIELLEIVG